MVFSSWFGIVFDVGSGWGGCGDGGCGEGDGRRGRMYASRFAFGVLVCFVPPDPLRSADLLGVSARPERRGRLYPRLFCVLRPTFCAFLSSFLIRYPSSLLSLALASLFARPPILLLRFTTPLACSHLISPFTRPHILTHTPPFPSLGSNGPTPHPPSSTTGGVPLTPSSPHPLPSTYALLQRHTPSPTITQPGAPVPAGRQRSRSRPPSQAGLGVSLPGSINVSRRSSLASFPTRFLLFFLVSYSLSSFPALLLHLLLRRLRTPTSTTYLTETEYEFANQPPFEPQNTQLPGGVGPARTTRQRRGSSISGTSPPPLGRPHAIVIPGRSSASSSASNPSNPNGNNGNAPLSAGGNNASQGQGGNGPNGNQGGNGNGQGGQGGTWFSGNEYSLPTPDSMTGHSYGHIGAGGGGYGPFSLSPGGG